MDFVTQARAAVDAELAHARRAAAGNPGLPAVVDAVSNAFAALIAHLAPPVADEPPAETIDPTTLVVNEPPPAPAP